ncbi:type VI secretion system baseplate subunit TssG [Paludibacterium purpuratum]|uniref:Type VI secretion system protein ImpH n=1 Tax=Paludibacterium purpuratum TaxID=1144873 RepID=A0A4R7B635_9NEIS|nr:type VI secretion system baseplate subunit TssG [Paludibacterium purpuratum]TDR78363.1 type VI secretion system protein ImpH [Paludibacterium purpuratum]
MLDDLDLARRAPHYQLRALLRAIECRAAGLPRLGTARRLRDEAIRLGQDPDMAFTASPLARMTPGKNGRPARLAINLLGLAGPQGPLPLAISEYVSNRVTQAGDTGWRAFLDLFHHRLHTLHYRAWAAAQPAVAAERPDDDAFADHLASVAGLVRPALVAGPVPWAAQLHFAALLADRRRPASGLARLLHSYFQLPVRIEPFAGEYLSLASHECTRLGSSRTPLGFGLALGTRVWSVQHRFRVIFGPLTSTDCMRLAPGGASFDALQYWVRRYSTGHDWQLELQLSPEAWQAARLGQTRLARAAWLGRPRSPHLRFNPSHYQHQEAPHG